jgi:Surface-adhesin protein E
MPFSIRPSRRMPLAYFSSFCLPITLLVLSRGPAYAEWEKVTDDTENTPYVDSDTIRRKGNLVKMWELRDYTNIRTVEAGSLLSVKALNEYDCAEERQRVLALVEYSNNMGRGKLVYTDSITGEWSQIVPETVGQTMLKLACGNK